MSNYSSVDYNIRLSPEAPEALFEFLNHAQNLEAEDAAQLKHIKEIPGFKEFSEAPRFWDCLSNQGSYDSGDIVVSERPVISKENPVIRIPVSNQKANWALPFFLQFLSPYIVNKDEVLAYVRDEYDSESNTEGNLYYIDKDNKVCSMPVYFEHYDMDDIITGIEQGHEKLIKLKNVKRLKIRRDDNNFWG